MEEKEKLRVIHDWSSAVHRKAVGEESIKYVLRTHTYFDEILQCRKTSVVKELGGAFLSACAKSTGSIATRGVSSVAVGISCETVCSWLDCILTGWNGPEGKTQGVTTESASLRVDGMWWGRVGEPRNDEEGSYR